ncbi:MAG: hypothetical protein AAFY71_23780 [Bacteroidota bacterium]
MDILFGDYDCLAGTFFLAKKYPKSQARPDAFAWSTPFSQWACTASPLVLGWQVGDWVFYLVITMVWLVLFSWQKSTQKAQHAQMPSLGPPPAPDGRARPDRFCRLRGWEVGDWVFYLVATIVLVVLFSW